MNESIDSIRSERDFLWEQCQKLYNAITHNGVLAAGTFRQAVGVAGSMFKDRGVDLKQSTPWFEAIANFLETIETARKQKVGPKC